MDLGGPDPREGDTALAALLLAHGMIMNGGVDHALEALSKEQYAAAVRGFRYFGLSEAAAVLEKAAAGVPDAAALDVEYGRVVSDDGRLVHAFRLKLVASPEAFAPISTVRHA